MSVDSPFEISIGKDAPDVLRVVSFQGRERLSKPFQWDIVVAGHELDEATFPRSALGQPVRLLIHRAEGARVLRGVVGRVASAGKHLHDRTAWKLRVVPHFALLRHRRNTRIFQDQTPADVVSTLLKEAGLAHTWETHRTYATRSYCVQYEETDFDFIQRQLAGVGIFYHFEHGGPDAPDNLTETIVFRDTADPNPIDGDMAMVYRAADGVGTLHIKEHHITAFQTIQAAAPRSILRRDYDFQRPLAVLQVSARDEVAGSSLTGPAEVYEHHGEFVEPEAVQKLEEVALSQLRRKAQTNNGGSQCPRLLVGRRFRLKEHEIGGLDGEYLLTTIEHEGHSPEIVGQVGDDGASDTANKSRVTYKNTFTCVPANVTFRPSRRPRQFRQVVETAVVTGPAGQEIYTDSLGRIKVQFHWDREGKKNEFSSCFMRVAQTWAGTGWGFQFIPRIGMEVLVSFLGGDPDRPMVVGCVPNATHPPPYPLPENQTTSGIKTESTPGGGGFNEILFNDAKGGELVSIRAERNFTETVLNDHLQTVSNDQTVVVAGKRTIEVKGEDSFKVDGGQTVKVRGASAVSVGGGANANIAGNRTSNVAGDDTTRIGGGQVTMATGYSHLLIGQGAPEGHGLVMVNGNYRIGAAKAIEIGAAERVRLTCGASIIEILPDEIKIKSPKITMVAEEEFFLKGNEHELAFTDHAEMRGTDIRLFGKEGQLILDEDGKLNGRVVKLNCDKPKPEVKELKEEAESGEILFRLKPNFELSKDLDLIAVIAGPDGKTVEKVADANREVRIQGKPGEHYVLVDIRQGDRSLSKKNIG